MVEGVISRTSSKPWQNKMFYSFALSGQEGWFSTGIKRPPAEGVSVRFEYKTNSKGYKEVDGPIEIRTDGEAGPAPKLNGISDAASNSKSSGSSNSGAYWDRKEARDVHNDELREIGATRNTAIALIDLMVKHEAIKLPAVAKREGFLWDVLNRYVDKLRGKESVAVDKEQASTGLAKEAPGVTSNDAEPDVWN